MWLKLVELLSKDTGIRTLFTQHPLKWGHLLLIRTHVLRPRVAIIIGGIPLYCSFHGYRPNNVHQHFGIYNLLCDCDILHCTCAGWGMVWWGWSVAVSTKPSQEDPRKTNVAAARGNRTCGAKEGVWCVWVNVWVCVCVCVCVGVCILGSVHTSVISD